MTDLTVTKKLIPFGLGERLSTEIFPVDGVHPHVAVTWVDHGAEHAAKRW